MGIEDQALSRSAIWYVGAFAVLGSVLLAGASVASVNWSQAAHPSAALLLLAAAIAAAFTVVTLASRVISPGCTVAVLRQLEDRAQRGLQRRNGGKAVDWSQIASKNRRVLRALYNDESDFRRSPNDLWAAAKTGDEDARNELTSMVAAGNGWLAYRRYRGLRYVTPIAAVIVLVGGVAWKPLTVPAATDSATLAKPLPVVVELAPEAMPARVIGPGCSLRVLDGVAIAGSFKSVVTVAFAPQKDCPAVVVDLSPSEALVRLR